MEAQKVQKHRFDEIPFWFIKKYINILGLNTKKGNYISIKNIKVKIYSKTLYRSVVHRLISGKLGFHV